jgi:large subunit ribosomal protein L10
MQRQQKHEFVKSFREQLSKTPLVVVGHYRGNSVNETNQIRRKLDASGVNYRVVKNSLAKLAMVEAGMAALADQLTGMSLVILSSEDPVASAKSIRDVLAGNEKITLQGGFWDGVFLDVAGVKAIGDLPSRETLQSLLLATIQAPAQQLLGILQAPARDLINLLSNYQQKLSESEAS